MSNITLNIVEPGTPPSPTPIDPVTPNTGLFTSSIGGPEATIITAVSAALILTITAIVVAFLYRKQKKSGKVTKLVHIIDSTKAIITSKERLSAALTAIALLVSAGTFVALAKNAVNASESDEQSQTEGTNDSSLTVDVSSEELTIEVADEPVFAILPVDVTVEEATPAGYTLTAYTNNTDLVSTTNPDNIIPMVTLPESSIETLESSETAGELSPLTDNTYGLALGEEPTSKDAAVYMPLSIDSDIPTIIKSMPEYTPTEENDTTTIYYGFYITPDIPYGTYTNDSEVYYNATINTTPVTFDGNGLYFNEDEQQTTNEVTYIAVPEEGKEYNINQIVSGEYKTPSQDLPYNFLGWSTDPEATVPTYETEEKIAEFLPISPNTPITLYAVWQKATTITFDNNGGVGEMNKQTIIAGKSANLFSNTFTKDGYTFTGWNTRADGEGQEYLEGAEYIAQADYAGYVTLYAQWKELCPANSICYRPNGANSTPTMSDQSASSNTETTLWASNYKYDTNNDRHNDYGFAGWSEDKDAATKLVDNDPTNNPVVYGPNQTITTGDLSLEGMKLYAVWIAPEENTTFQTFTCPSNTDMPIGTVIALRDNRDNEVYTVAKLADGNCWMTENLRLDNNAAINSANTHSPISSFTALSSSSSSWCTQNTDACYNQSLLNTNNIASTVSEMTGKGANIYSYSNYYNWYSATAGNGTRSVSSGTVSGDICPAGWHLPYGGDQTSEKGGNTSGGFYYLNNRIGGDSNAWRSFPNNFVYSGYWYSSTAYDRGSFGYYWSSTAYGTSYAYSLYFGSSNVGPGTGDSSKNYGHSVRCVAPAE